MARKIIQLYISKAGDNCALADDGTVWYWCQQESEALAGWQPWLDPLPQDEPRFRAILTRLKAKP